MAPDEIREGHLPPTGETIGESSEDLLARIRAGDAAAFETVFRTYFNALDAFAFRFLRSREAASDVVQEVFLNVWRHRVTWAVSGSIKSYLFTSVRNRSIDLLKRNAVAEHWAKEASLQRSGDVAAPQAEADLEASDLTRALEQALKTFPERRRQVFLLRFKEGLSYTEIAEVMGTTTKTVENQVNRALRSLREQLRPFAP